jgi:hypothetical protein
VPNRGDLIVRSDGKKSNEIFVSSYAVTSDANAVAKIIERSGALSHRANRKKNRFARAI